MKNVSAKTATRIASQYIEDGKFDDAKYVLDFYDRLKLDGDVLVTLDESTNREYMTLGFDSVDIEYLNKSSDS